MEAEPITARLRRPFTYDSDDSLPEAIDEEEQESVIRTLAAENAARNARFAKTLLLLPLACAVVYVATPAGLTPLLRLLAVQSLLATAYALYVFRPEETGFPLLDAWASSGSNKGPRPVRAANNSSRWPVSGSGRSPVSTYLPYLNLGLSAVVLLAGAVRGGSFLDRALASLPAVIYALVLAAKLTMAGVDPESELASLKYDYKGA